MKRFLFVAGVTAAAAGCYSVETPGENGAGPGSLGSFKVEVKSIKGPDGRALPVVQSCAKRYGGDALVPAEARGTADCRYSIPQGNLEVEVGITAVDGANQPLTSFNGPVSFRVKPGNLAGSYLTRWESLTNGQGTDKVIVSHVYGEVRVWVQDEPPQVDYVDGAIAGDTSELPQEPKERTYVTGLSQPLFFEEPTLARVQQPDDITNNRNSPFGAHFLTIGRAPESGATLRQDCPPLPMLPGGKPYSFQRADEMSDTPGGVTDPGNEQLMTLLVTGTDPSGFFVTDITACRAREITPSNTSTWVPEPEGLLPGTYGSAYIYNYSFPEDLYAGDLLWTLSGSVQDFTGTTQLTFPAWTVREHVRLLPQAQWNKYLDLVKPADISLRLCGSGANGANVDALCGYYYDNQKMESLEAALVKLTNVRFPQVFKSCDFDGNNEVPFFCMSGGNWARCGEETANAEAERKCNQDCVIGTGEHAGKVCSERTSHASFGQFVVELAGPGPAAARLDESLPQRIQKLDVTKGAVTSIAYVVGAPLRVWCDTAVRVKFGPRGTVATASDTPLPARTLLERPLTGNEGVVSFLMDGEKDPAGQGQCHVAVNSRTRMNVVTRDAVPDLVVDCSEDDADAEKARQCRNLHGARFDVVGHLKQVTAARPRWTVTPRDADDLCCRPGKDLECPKPIKQCAQ